MEEKNNKKVSTEPRKFAEIMKAFELYLTKKVDEERNKLLEEKKKAEKNFWKEDLKRYEMLANDIEIAKYDYDIDCRDLDENKFAENGAKIDKEPSVVTQDEQWKAIAKRKGFIKGTIDDRQKDLKKEYENFIKNLFLVPSKQECEEEAPVLKSDRRFRTKFEKFVAKWDRKFQLFERKYMYRKNDMFRAFLEKNYPEEKDTLELKGIFMGKVKRFTENERPFNSEDSFTKKGNKAVDEAKAIIPSEMVKQLSRKINERNKNTSKAKGSSHKAQEARVASSTKGRFMSR